MVNIDTDKEDIIKSLIADNKELSDKLSFKIIQLSNTSDALKYLEKKNYALEKCQKENSHYFDENKTLNETINTLSIENKKLNDNYHKALKFVYDTGFNIIEDKAVVYMFDENYNNATLMIHSMSRQITAAKEEILVLKKDNYRLDQELHKIKTTSKAEIQDESNE